MCACMCMHVHVVDAYGMLTYLCAGRRLTPGHLPLLLSNLFSETVSVTELRTH